jgi:carboxyl-terminal processing protease
MILVLGTACKTTPVTTAFGDEELPNNYSTLSWEEAFSTLHRQLATEYAFTEWKSIDWNALYDTYNPQIITSQANQDFPAYYLALRSYLHQIPDRHVSISNRTDIDDQYIGGGFGFAIAQLDDTSVIATWVEEQGEAWNAGMRSGCEILSWDGIPISEALSAVVPIFTGNCATSEDLKLAQQHYLVRAPKGEQHQVTFRSIQNTNVHTVQVSSYDDNKASLSKGYPDSVVSDRIRKAFLEIETDEPMPRSMVETTSLAEGIVYIKVWGLLDADLQLTGEIPSTVDLFEQAVAKAVEQNAKGIIIDIRNNIGGMDQMAADLLGSFYAEQTFYEYQNAYNPETGTWELLVSSEENGKQPVIIEPRAVHYKGPVIALVNSHCVSSGEGIAMGIRNLSNGEVLGFYGTNGSFGLASGIAVMPGGLIVHWPNGQSLDENHEIQLDSRNGIGGVAPTIRIPMTKDHAVSIAQGVDVELQEAMQILAFPKKP